MVSHLRPVKSVFFLARVDGVGMVWRRKSPSWQMANGVGVGVRRRARCRCASATSARLQTRSRRQKKPSIPSRQNINPPITKPPIAAQPLASPWLHRRPQSLSATVQVCVDLEIVASVWQASCASAGGAPDADSSPQCEDGCRSMASNVHKHMLVIAHRL